MSATPRLPVPTHAALDFLTGMAMMVAPALLGLGPRGLILTVSLGAILTGMALSLSGGPEGRQIAWHRQFDSLFVFVTGLAGLWLAISGEAKGAVVLASVVVIQTLVNQTTRYVAAD